MAKILSSGFRLPLFRQSRLGRIYQTSIFINSLWKLVEVFLELFIYGIGYRNEVFLIEYNCIAEFKTKKEEKVYAF